MNDGEAEIIKRLKAFGATARQRFPTAVRTLASIKVSMAFLPTSWSADDAEFVYRCWLRGTTACDIIVLIGCAIICIPDKFGWIWLYFCWIVGFARYGRRDRQSRTR